jgi:hypothetical protein
MQTAFFSFYLHTASVDTLLATFQRILTEPDNITQLYGRNNNNNDHNKPTPCQTVCDMRLFAHELCGNSCDTTSNY